MKTTLVVQICAIACVSSVVQAGVVIELVPDNPGPYFGGESVTVDVWAESSLSTDVGLRGIQFDFNNADPSLFLDSAFVFDFSSIPGDYNAYSTSVDLPVPWTFMPLDCFCPAYLIQVPGEGSVRLRSVGVKLPGYAGEYRLDVLNPDEPDPVFGAWMRIGFTSGPQGLWRAYTGEIVGGTYDFVVIPELPTAMLAMIGVLGMTLPCRRLRRRSNVKGNVMMRIGVLIGAIACVCSVAQAGVVVELVPDNPGPYFGGESVTVDVLLHSEEPSDVDLRTVYFDFSQTDSEISLDSSFEFDLSWVRLAFLLRVTS